ncbi:uncharacterized protein H6S33_005413 [Morchella sextelata]|uniref:uncharacterized protein n=1 Tax=Morchella sextelata TaxID=1174677 RepID=UPI001D04D6BA|nr:uncharacterized protein H6S33_005413 [Morchella sextelata]KAH0613527.1 hypothetical protein H6S33_005413 [Morchella sextelata]
MDNHIPDISDKGLHDRAFAPYPSRRSVIHSTNGIVSCTQPLAAQAGLRILQAGGNAADAVIAVASCLNVTEPTSTGIGGDAFCLFYNASTKKIHGLNASGRSPTALTLERALADIPAAERSQDRIPMTHVHSVTVPGAASAWCDTVERFGSGKFTLSEVLADAIRLAEDGYPVSEVTAANWALGVERLVGASPNSGEMLIDGRAPREGEVIRLSNLAKVYRELGEKGRKGFYEGWVAEALVEVLKSRGGVMELEDLKKMGEVGSEETEAVGLVYERTGLKLWEHAPNGQGIVALMALGILESLQERGVVPDIGKEGSHAHNSAEYLHTIIESLKIAFADGHWFIADPAHSKVPTKGLLDKEYLAARSKLFDPCVATKTPAHGSPALRSSDTVYFTVVDAQGNAASFINSNYAGFGSAMIPKGCGFTLQNRGSGFSLSADHPNVLAPSKRPYHTIIPALITDAKTGELHTAFGVMGGYMQPQGHVQVFLNTCVWGMSVQQALDAPRICVGGGYDPSHPLVQIEEGISEETVEKLRNLGHNVVVVTGWSRGVFGRGQVIRVKHCPDGKRILSAGSDLRGDGHAVGY